MFFLILSRSCGLSMITRILFIYIISIHLGPDLARGQNLVHPLDQGIQQIFFLQNVLQLNNISYCNTYFMLYFNIQEMIGIFVTEYYA